MTKNKKTITSLIFKIVALVAILTTSTVIMVRKAMGWFSNNKDVSGSGMSITVDSASFFVEVYDEDMTNPRDINTISNIAYDLDIPGSSIIFVYKITNTSRNKTLKLDRLFYIAPTSEEEVAKTVDTTDYWLSTQLYLKCVPFTKNTTPPASAVSSAFNVNGENPTDAELYGTVLYDGTGTGPGEYTIYVDNAERDDIVLSYNEYCYFAVKVTFKNDPNNSQNVYVDFGKGDNPAYFCKRLLSFDYS